jgi:hypothetical protein
MLHEARVHKVEFAPPPPLLSNQVTSNSVSGFGNADRKILPHHFALI